ncbi:hypothetical protein HS125_17275 [bacterium]|nr:hypothetical protein [bacterium]
MNRAVRQYLRDVERTLAAGNATEHSYRPAFKALVESFGTGIEATNEPKRVACGAPDFIVQRGQAPIGYIECKDIGVPLNEIEKTGQFKRYLDSLQNLILTDYLEFRYFLDGERPCSVLNAFRHQR